jgi:hypothetical protein
MHPSWLFYCLPVLPGERNLWRKISLTDCLQSQFFKPAKLSRLFTIVEIWNFSMFVTIGRLAHGGNFPVAVSSQLGGVWSMVSYFQKIFSPSAQSPGARQPVLALSEGLDPLSLQGSAFSVQAARQLWPLTRLLSIV